MGSTPVTLIVPDSAVAWPITWRGARAVGVKVRRPHPREREVQGAVDTEIVTARLEADEIKAGRVVWRDVDFLIADLEVFKVFQLEKKPVAIVGSGLFSRRDFVIDFGRSRLLVRVATH